jgi:hypothetical protein
MGKDKDLAPWREMGRAAVIISVAVAFYTVAVALASPDQLLGWLNTLISTVLSVFFALVVGLALFRYQTKETDRKKREDLTALLETELGKLCRSFLGSRTVVPDEVLEDRLPCASHEIRLSVHHPHPLVIEEAARSGLFGPEPTATMLVLARQMRAHNLFLREATSLEPHLDRAWATGLDHQAGQEEFFRLLRRYAQAAKMVQRSEESIVAGCEEVLEGLH